MNEDCQGTAGAGCSIRDREPGATCDNTAIGAGTPQPGPRPTVPEQGKQSSLWAVARISHQSRPSDKSMGMSQIPVQAGKTSCQMWLQMSGVRGQIQATAAV